MQLTKQAFAFVFDRATGKPVWPIEERPVPTSDTPGERTAPTQPFPTKPPPFDRQGVTIDDLIDFTPELRAEALELVKQYRIGPLFTPPSVQERRSDGTRARCSCPARSAAPTGRAARSIRRPGCSMSQSITRPFVADHPQGRSGENQSRLRARHARLSRGAAGTAAAQAAVRPHHRDRSEQGRPALDGAQRRRTARPSVC